MRAEPYPIDELAWLRTCAGLEGVAALDNPGTRLAIRNANRQNWRDRKWIAALAARYLAD